LLRRELVEHIQAIPGVDAAAETASLPVVDGHNWINTMWMDGSDVSNGRDIFRSLVGSGYFHTIGTPLLAGREFDERDTPTSQNAAIVSEEFARVFSLGPDPVGKKFWIERTPIGGYAEIACEIVGVVKNSKYRDLRQDLVPVAYFPISQFPQPVTGFNVLIRSRVGLDALTPSVRRAISDVNPNIGYSFSVFKTRIEESLLRERLMAILSGLFGGLAVLLATVGLYGVISYTVARRTNEIGIRIALGAGKANVIGLILRETGMLLAVGLGAGVAISLAVGRAAATLLFGLEPSDPLTVAAAGAALALVAMSASYLPARRASRVDPMVALRNE
jgi:predicted permease